MQLDLFDLASTTDIAVEVQPASKPLAAGETDTDCTLLVTSTIHLRAQFVRESKYGRAEVRFEGRLQEVNRRCVIRDGEAA
jgi:acyl-coenzyme A thioesterase PaaI-like protein